MPYPESRKRGLIPWQKGQSGSTREQKTGRKKGLVTLIKEALEGDSLQGVKTPDKRTIAEHYAELIIAHGMRGNAPYMTQTMDRLYGKVGSPAQDEEETQEQPLSTPELDEWAKQRLQAQQDREKRSVTEPSGLRGTDERGTMGMGSTHGPAQ